MLISVAIKVGIGVGGKGVSTIKMMGGSGVSVGGGLGLRVGAQFHAGPDA